MSEVPGILGRIVERTLEDVRLRQDPGKRREIEAAATRRAPRRRDLAEALRRKEASDPVRFICEVKKASPSKGLLSPDLDPASLAEVYREAGASAISVVTEPHFFQGEDTFLARARSKADDLPLLRKDFHVDEWQILEAAAGEADAILLLASVLSAMQLKDYLDVADAFGLGHLVEVVSRREAETALKAGARVIGINNRDLTTFEVDPARTETVLPVLQEANRVSVAESGIHDRETVERFEKAGVHALLVGEALVTAGNPGEKLRELRGVEGDSGAGS